MYLQPQDVQSASEDEEPGDLRPPCLGAESTAHPVTGGATTHDGEAEVTPEPEQKPAMEPEQKPAMEAKQKPAMEAALATEATPAIEATPATSSATKAVTDAAEGLSACAVVAPNRMVPKSQLSKVNIAHYIPCRSLAGPQ